jgi:hypothetical protein
MGLETDVSIPFKAEEPQRPLELVGLARNAAFAIEIVDPEQPAATRTARAEVAAGRGQERAEVKRS